MNARNPAIRRILADVRELEKHPSSRYHATPCEGNMFEWHFTIRGPVDTHFEGGIYHGRILLPSEYPFKPPNIIFLTKNGRFEVGTKICLSISAYHQESWQPAWGVRTMLEAIISFLPTEGAGAIGALDWTADERKKLAKESISFVCPLCGPVAKLLSEPSGDGMDKVDSAIAAQISQLHLTQASTDSEKIIKRSVTEEISGVNSRIDSIESPQIIQDENMKEVNLIQKDCGILHKDNVTESYSSITNQIKVVASTPGVSSNIKTDSSNDSFKDLNDGKTMPTESDRPTNVVPPSETPLRIPPRNVPPPPQRVDQVEQNGGNDPIRREGRDYIDDGLSVIIVITAWIISWIVVNIIQRLKEP